MYEEVKIEKVTGTCSYCEGYAKSHSTTPAKIAIMSCEGACARGEVSRRVANMIAHKYSPDNTVRICLGGAFTKDTGQRDLVRRASKVVALEGCFINCSSRMMKGVIPELDALVIDVSEIYGKDIPFGIDEVSDDEFNQLAEMAAKVIVEEYVNGDATSAVPQGSCCSSDESACCQG